MDHCYWIIAWPSQYVVAFSYYSRTNCTPLPPSAFPKAFRIIVIGFIGVS